MSKIRCLLLLQLTVAVAVAFASASPLVFRLSALESCSSAYGLRATLRVFSGTSDPSWRLDARDVLTLQRLLKALPTAASRGQNITSRALGYQGFVLACAGDARGVLVRQQPSLEKFLLSTAVSSGALRQHPLVVEHVESHIGEAGPFSEDELTFVGAVDGGLSGDGLAVPAEGACQQWCPIRGPDTPPQYDPARDDKGCFESDQTLNNCYAYGTDIVTDTFPQPGRGSGHKWTINDCSNMGAASESDGLMYFGTKLPTSQPSRGHYAALLIWPDTNFHWIRKDADAPYWSHKPGGTPVRNTDNNGALITDPSKADFSPWTQFCAYYVAVPSNLTIN